MKFCVILILSIISFSRVSAQENADTIFYSADEVYGILTDSLPDKLGVGCGRAGADTENIEYFLMFVEAEKYDFIKKLAFSDYASNQFLAVLAIELLEERKMILVDEDLKKRIETKKKSDRRFDSCYGCSPGKSKKLNDLFSKNIEEDYLVERLQRYLKSAINKT